MILKAENLRKSFEEREILHGINLQVERGTFLSIMGESGSGKSTLLNLLAGNLRPDSGSVLLDGTDLTLLNDRQMAKLRRTQIGFVFQSLNLLSTLNAADNILLPLVLDHANVRKGRDRMTELADLLNISGLLSAFPSSLSGGERQRVAIARAMVHDPLLLLLDEPTGSLDSASSDEVMHLLTRLNRENGVTVIQVTHSDRAASYGNRIIRISDGQVTE